MKTLEIPKDSKLNLWPTPNVLQAGIRESQEQEVFCIRFDDLTEKAKRKFCALIKKRSPIYTVRKEEEQGGITALEIYHALRIANPPIVTNWSPRFSNGAFNTWAATKVSRIIFNICRRNPTDAKQIEVKRMISTEGNINTNATSIYYSYRSNQDVNINTLLEGWDRLLDRMTDNTPGYAATLGVNISSPIAIIQGVTAKQ